jgi:ubiquinone/menaquinone biosynthesis C-methylase UbiE
MMTAPNDKRYPALMLDSLTPVYDYFVRLLMPEQRLKRALIAHAQIAPDQPVLDLGAGTGTLAIMLKQLQPEARVTGLDGDPKILVIARKKATRANTEITFDVGNVAALPYPNESFDRVVSSLVLSLLSSEDKQRTIGEAYRVLRTGGKLVIADFGPPHTRWGNFVAPLLRRYDRIADNLDGRLPAMFRLAGFGNIEEATRFATLFGTLSIISGRKLDCLSRGVE